MDLSSLTGLFVGLHAALAQRTDVEGFAFDHDRAGAYLNAWQNVLRHAPVKTTQLGIDVSVLTVLTFGMYGPPVMELMAKRRPQRTGPKVVRFPVAEAPRNAAPKAPPPTPPFSNPLEQTTLADFPEIHANADDGSSYDHSA